MKRASKQFKIPRSTIHNKLKNKHTSAVGHPATFTEQEEKLFKIRTVLLCDWGFPLDSLDPRMMVVWKFKNNIPGEDWARRFIKRWNLTNRTASNICRKQAKTSQSELQSYFENIQKELDDVPSPHIWNYDETNLRDDPGTS